jgi:DNA-binding HxlR family transcriptional regulator
MKFVGMHDSPFPSASLDAEKASSTLPRRAQVRTLSKGTNTEGSNAKKVAHRRGDDHRSNCAVEAALSVIGGRWKGVVLYWLLSGTHRFGELRRRVPQCSERMLTVQLRELEEDGLIKRTVYAEVPPRVEYTITAFGESLKPVLQGLREWGERYKRRLT